MKETRTAATLAKLICVEAGELLECFQWDEQNINVQQVEKELADIEVYCDELRALLGTKKK